MSKALIDSVFGLRGRRPGVVYIIDEGDDSSHVKIGFARNLDQRLAMLRTGNPRPLRLLYSEPGWMRMEKLVHSAVSDARVNGEWFARTESVKALIELAQTHGLRDGLGWLAENGTAPGWSVPADPPHPPHIMRRRHERHLWHRSREAATL